MEFDINEFEIVGCIQHKISEQHAKIKVLGYIDEQQIFCRLSEEQSIAYFPPHGYVFEPGFFRNYPYSEGDFISFYAELNQKTDPESDNDVYKIEYKCPDVNLIGECYRELNNFIIEDGALDVEKLSVKHNQEDNLDDGEFYGITDKYIIGKFSIEDNIISASNKSDVKVWKLNEDNLLWCGDYSCLISIPKDHLFVLDCLNYKGILDWFRKQLRCKNTKYIEYLDRETSWKKDLLSSFACVGEEVKQINTIRYNRIVKMFDVIELDNHAIKDIIDYSDNFKELFINEVERHKNEYIQHEIEKDNLDLLDFKNRIEEEKAEIDIQFDEYKKKIETSEAILQKKNDELIQINQSISDLTEHKERIIQDFHIVKEVLGIQTSNSNNNNQMHNENYVLTDISRGKESVPQQSGDTIAEIAYILNEYKMNPKYAIRLYPCIMNMKASLIGDIRIGIAIAKASHNASFLVLPVEPDWLHFDDLWNHGLAQIWHSAHENKDRLFFLILQDVNMSSPECYLRPINNILSGLVDTLPLSHLSFPKNLRILATIASSEDPEIGLTINKDTFKEWGAVGFNDLSCKEFTKLTSPEKDTFLKSFSTKMEEYEKTDLSRHIQNEFKVMLKD